MENEIELKEVTAETLSSDAVSEVQDIRNSLEGIIARANKSISDLYQCAATKLRSDETNPWVAVGIAIGLGLALGWAVRRRSTRT
jgi:ElaB/YqjD/DUF883 family membrane-anchored ribosome-binding protein